MTLFDDIGTDLSRTCAEPHAQALWSKDDATGFGVTVAGAVRLDADDCST